LTGRRLRDVLLVDDNPGDVRLTREALKECGLASALSVAGDGEQALAFLRRAGAHAAAPRPDMVVLDLNLPKVNGRQVLAALAADPALRDIPVVVLTTSKADKEALRDYEGPLYRYVVKPRELDEFVAVIRGLEEFWRAATRAART
jgi:CheY-like chemotaxis protein